MDIKQRDKLVAAYDHMVENVSSAIHDAEEAIAPTVDEMIHNAQLLARDLYALSQEEAESLADTLRRDMHKADEALNRQSKELKDWWSFDLALVEDKFTEMIARAADKTWLDLQAFRSEDHQASVYSSGEVCTAGTFSCSNCDHSFKLTATGQIEPCHECGNEEFYRVIA
jgi:hypothetical protein